MPGLIGTRHVQGRKAKISEDTHPLVREMLRLFGLLSVSVERASIKAGVEYGTVKAWWATKANKPTLDNLDKMFGVVGLRLCLRPAASRE